MATSLKADNFNKHARENIFRFTVEMVYGDESISNYFIFFFI